VNLLLEERYVERVTRLALGIELIDACRGGRIPDPLRIAVDKPLALDEVPRHDSCLHALVYSKDVTSPVTVRILSPDRRFVPRRLEFPIGSEADAIAGLLPVARRSWRPRLFPGAAYDISASATGVRGRVIWQDDGSPVRFARIVAFHTEPDFTGNEPIALAHGDDRGEFLLVVGVDEDLGDAFDLSVPPVLPPSVGLLLTIVAPNVRPVDDPADPLYGLPLEYAAGPGLPDPVSLGERLPDTYRNPGRVFVDTVDVPLGRITSFATTPFEIPYP
jgi:hypothetical protein